MYISVWRCSPETMDRYFFLNFVFLVVVLVVVVVWLPPAMPQAALAMVLALA